MNKLDILKLKQSLQARYM